MKNKIIKIFLAFMIIIAIFNIFPVYTEAFEDPTKNPGAWNPTLDKEPSQKYQSILGSLLGYINVIGIVISVIVLVVIGIKYMLGSVEEKAEYKKTMMGYLIGALLLFMTTTIANILYIIGTSLFS